jgi:hypothetical protein
MLNARVYANLHWRYIDDCVARCVFDIDQLYLIVHLPAEVIELEQIDGRADAWHGFNERSDPSEHPIARPAAFDGRQGLAIERIADGKILDFDCSHVISPGDRIFQNVFNKMRLAQILCFAKHVLLTHLNCSTKNRLKRRPFDSATFRFGQIGEGEIRLHRVHFPY